MTGRASVAAIIVLLVLPALAYVYLRYEGDPPTIGSVPAISLGSAPVSFTLELSDADSGLRSVDVRVAHEGGSKQLVFRTFEGDLFTGGETQSESIEVELDAAALPLPEGPAKLVIVVRDWSWRDGFEGNAAELEHAFDVDTIPPDLTVESGLTYIYRGGSGAAIYRSGENPVQDGVRVADAFFPGHALEDADGGRRVAIFAIPVDAPTDPPVRVVASDAAGNEASVPLTVHIFERSFTKSTIPLSQHFLESTVKPLATKNGIRATDLAEAFREVNETLRARNEATIREALARSSSTRYWNGAFRQMGGSKVTSRFAESRRYQAEGKYVSSATHYGFDLASTARAVVTAANAGVVVFADDLGIYGQCVLIDHGLGVGSLYGHLSQIEVKAGDRVARGQRLGRSGATGLAGGDHLHFAILVGAYYVDPLEWWDPKWVRSHVESRLSAPER